MHTTRLLARTFALVVALGAAVLVPDGAARAGDAPRAIAAIENDLVADDAAVRAKAAAELTDRFPDGAVAVPMLVDLLDDESPEVVKAAAKAIDSMAVAGVARLAPYYADDAHLRPGTVIGDTLAMALGLGSPSGLAAFDRSRVAAGQTTTDDVAYAALFPAREELVGDEQSTVPLLLTAAANSANDVKPSVAAALAMYGADALVEKSIAPTPHPGRDAASAAAAALVKSPRDLRAWIGTRLLLRLRPSDAAAIGALQDALSAEKEPEPAKMGRPVIAARVGAAEVLGAIGEPAVAAAPALIRSLTNEEDGVAQILKSVHALVRMGKEADVLTALAAKPTTADILAVGLSMEQRGASAVVPVLAAIAGAPEGHKGFAVAALARYGASAASALPLLKRRSAEAEDIGLKLIYADALLAIAPSDPDGLKILAAALKDPDIADAARADPGRPIAILAKRAAPGASVATQCQAYVDKAAAGKDDPFVDLNVFDGLGRCGAAAKTAVPGLVRILSKADAICGKVERRPRYSLQRHRVAVALGKIGPDAAAAVPTLTALRDKGDETVRVAAAQALRRIKAKK